jgi:hypothetical protein
LASWNNQESDFQPVAARAKAAWVNGRLR